MKNLIFYLIAVFLQFQGVSFGQISTEEGKIKAFELKDVQLKESPFKNAQDVDLQYILELEPDRLLAPFLREAELEPKVRSYPNWEDSGLDGHIGGHYLTALALMHASTGNQELLGRLNYMLAELKRAQDAYGTGYIGGVPGSKELWREIEAGKLDPGNFSLNDRWVPLYNIHKTYAGLRDAYLYTNSELAKDMLVDYTDWMIDITENLSDEQIQSLLISEHGGLNETFADVARITGDDQYLDLAYKFSHKEVLQPLTEEKDRLNGMHGNTQIPKIIGFQTIADIAGDEKYHNASRFFWETVVNNRSVAIGGNSVREHFHPTHDFSSMIESEQGPETCNTYNMLRLSKKLFEAEGLERYIDYYERALYNHILSSQHPEKGGFVYFTPMRPGHYRVYSQPDTSFWCCVGSGLENHAKYNELIYAYTQDELYVNLYIPSVLNWEEKNFSLIQETNFPQEETATFLVETEIPQRLNLKLRYPAWVEEDMLEVRVNGKKEKLNVTPGSYVLIDRKWENGDKVEVKLPMHIAAEGLPDGSKYRALTYGPLVLATKIGEEDLQGLFADESRGGHIAAGPQRPLSEMPIFVSEEAEALPGKIKKVPGKELVFSASEVIFPERYKKLEFIPFYQVHEARYAIYLPVETPQVAREIQENLKEKEREERELEAATIDKVSPGEQQPESDHFIESKKSSIGVHRDRHWRDAEGWFSYKLKDKNNLANKIRVTYFGEDLGRNFRILVNGEVIAEESFNGSRGNKFFNVDYTIPDSVLQKSQGELTVRFEAQKNSRTAGVYDLRLMK